MESTFAGLGVIGVLLLLFIAILWILLPFAVFGIKDLAKTLIAEQKKTNRILGAEPTSETHTKCTECCEPVLKNAKKCKHCGSVLTPTA